MNKLSSPHPKEYPYDIWVQLVQLFQRWLKMLTDGWQTVGRDQKLSVWGFSRVYHCLRDSSFYLCKMTIFLLKTNLQINWDIVPLKTSCLTKSHKSWNKLWQPFCSAEQNHLCNFGKWCYEKQFCEIILNLDQWLRRKCCLKIFLSRALAALLFCRAKPFVQFW